MSQRRWPVVAVTHSRHCRQICRHETVNTRVVYDGVFDRQLTVCYGVLYSRHRLTPAHCINSNNRHNVNKSSSIDYLFPPYTYHFQQKAELSYGNPAGFLLYKLTRVSLSFHGIHSNQRSLPTFNVIFKMSVSHLLASIIYFPSTWYICLVSVPNSHTVLMPYPRHKILLTFY